MWGLLLRFSSAKCHDLNSSFPAAECWIRRSCCPIAPRIGTCEPLQQRLEVPVDHRAGPRVKESG
jgi:hypothetical protein